MNTLGPIVRTLVCSVRRRRKKISHFQIYKRGKAYVCGTYRFLSLQKMVDYFRRRPLYRKTKLTVAATEEIAVANVVSHEDRERTLVRRLRQGTQLQHWRCVAVQCVAM